MRLIAHVEAVVLAIFLTASPANGATLIPGHILYGDTNRGSTYGAVALVDPTTGVVDRVDSGSPITPVGITMDVTGDIYVAWPGRTGGVVIHIDPVTKQSTVISSVDVGTGPNFNRPLRDIVVDSAGDLLVASQWAIYRVDRLTGNRSIVSSDEVGVGPELRFVEGMDITADGSLIVAHGSDEAALLRINPVSGDRAYIANNIGVGGGAFLHAPSGVSVLPSGVLAVTDWAMGLMYMVDPDTGFRLIAASNTVGTGPNLVSPQDVVVDQNGVIYVADSAAEAIFRVDPLGPRTIVVDSTGAPPGSTFTPRSPFSLAIVPALVPEPASLAGDYNDNGIVDAADYTVWRDNVGSMATLPNDPLGGTIGQAHFDQWKANFGMTAGSGSGATGSASALANVPEPTSASLLMLAVVAACLHRRQLAWNSCSRGL